MPSPHSVAYLTDVEGRWDKLLEFTRANPLVSLDAAGRIQVQPGATFIFGGDAIDRGVHGRRLVRALLEVKKRQPGQVVLLAGNRDINKMRLPRELDGQPPKKTPDDVRAAPKPLLLRWIFSNTMGAAQAFEMRQKELLEVQRASSDDDVVRSYLEDLQPTGELTEYLCQCQLVYRKGVTLYVHGAVEEESLGLVPGAPRIEDVDQWAEALNGWYAEHLEAFRTARTDANGEPAWSGVVQYQAPLPGTRMNQSSVVYGRLTDGDMNPHLPRDGVIRKLQRAGIQRLVVGHTPSGDSPSILRNEDGFELIMADNSYGRLETGTRLLVGDERVDVRSSAQLDDGARVEIQFEKCLTVTDTPIGRRDEETGQLVKGMEDGRYLLFRGLPGFKVEQRGIAAADLTSRKLGIPRAR